MLSQNFCGLLLAVGVVGGVLADVDLTGGAGQPDADLVDGEIAGGVADGAEDAAPVGIAAKDSSLEQVGADHAAADGTGRFQVGGVGHLAGDEVGSTLAVTGVLGAHVLSNGGQGRHKGIVVGILFADFRVSGQTGSHDDQGIVGGGIQIHAHLVVGAGHHGLEGLFQQSGGNGGIGGVEGQHGGHVGGDHAAALANGTHGAGLAAQLKLDGVLLFVGIGGHNGRGRIGAALRSGSQLCGGSGDSPGKGVNDHGLADDTGGGGQHILGGDVQRLAHQPTALLGQSHAVGGAGVGVAAVDHDSLCIAVGQVGAVHLDGCAADLVGGVNTGGGAADVGLDERQIVFFAVICPDAAMDTGCCKTLGRADAARNFLILHNDFPFPQRNTPSVTAFAVPAPSWREPLRNRQLQKPPSSREVQSVNINSLTRITKSKISVIFSFTRVTSTCNLDLPLRGTSNLLPPVAETNR